MRMVYTLRCHAFHFYEKLGREFNCFVLWLNGARQVSRTIGDGVLGSSEPYLSLVELTSIALRLPILLNSATQVSNKWIHEKGNDLRRRCGLKMSDAERYVRD